MKTVIVGRGTIEAYTALWVAKRMLKTECEIVQLGQGDRLPDLAKKDVLFFGVSLSRNIVLRIQKEAASFYMFDNDFMGRQELAGVKDVKINMKQTAGRAAWEKLRADFRVKIGKDKKQEFHLSTAPWIVDFTENAKIWKWPDLNPQLVKLAIDNCYKQELESWDELSTRDLSVVIEQGKEFLQNKQKEGEENGERTGAEQAEAIPEHGSDTRRARRKLPKR